MIVMDLVDGLYTVIPCVFVIREVIVLQQPYFKKNKHPFYHVLYLVWAVIHGPARHGLGGYIKEATNSRRD